MNLATTKLNCDAWINANDNATVTVQFLIDESSEYAVLILEGKEYHIHRDHFIRLGNMAKPLTYKPDGSLSSRYV